MPPSVHPFFAVMLTLPAGDVDVNVHPTKREVRLREESKIGAILRRAVERALITGTSAKEMSAPGGAIFSFPSMPAAKEDGVPGERIVFGPGQRGFSPDMSYAMPASDAPLVPAGEQQTSFLEKNEGALKERLAQARFIGTFANKYHLFEVGESLFVVDQHAAQERILFEKFRRQITEGTLEVQPLLTPIVLNVTPQEMLAWESSGERLKEFGFELEPFGPSALAVRAHPAVIANPEQAVRVLLGEESLAKADPDVIARRACRASVMAGDRMAATEAAHQLKSLLSCDDPYTCPHGRPVFIELKTSFLDRQFLRV